MDQQQINQAQDDNLQGHNSALINAKFSDAASENQREIERELDADTASTPSYELHLENERRLKNNRPAGSTTEEHVSQPEHAGAKQANQDETAELGGERGGTTNLSPDQLREEGGAAR